jgi:hypothetical protein
MAKALLPTEPIAFALVNNQLTINPAYVECRAFDPHTLTDLNEDGLWQFNGPVSCLDHGDKSQNGHGHGLSQGDSAVTDGLQLHAIRLRRRCGQRTERGSLSFRLPTHPGPSRCVLPVAQA